MKHLDLFSGIGGFAFAAQTVWGDEYENVGFCDNEPFSQAVLKKHWPNAKIYDDIKELRTPPTADIVTGGFPCQPFSAAGKRRGKEDDRHLWPEMLRVIRAASPRWVIGENVGGLLTWNGGMVLDEVFADLEGEGYEVWAFVIPAAAVGAPHRRDRVWIIAHSHGNGGRTEIERGQEERGVIVSGGNQHGTDSSSERLQRLGHEAYEPREKPNDEQPDGRSGGGASSNATDSRRQQARNKERGGDAERSSNKSAGPNTAASNAHAGRFRRYKRQGSQETPAPRSSWKANWSEVATRLCRVDDGVPSRMDRADRLRALGNAIVPQVAAEIMRAIKMADEQGI